VDAPEGVRSLRMLPIWEMDPYFQATVEATDEAIVNALVAAESMTGADDHFVWALPHDRLIKLLRQYNRLQPVKKP
jgi:D-aminopeptidase